MTPFLRFSSLALFTLNLFGSLSGEVRAAEFTWQGLGNSDNWTDTHGNWSSSSPDPFPGYLSLYDTVLFGVSGSQSFNAIVNTRIVVASITYNAPGYSLRSISNFTITGGITATYDNAPNLSVGFTLQLGGTSTVRNLTGTAYIGQSLTPGTLNVVGPSSIYSGSIQDNISLTVGDGSHAANLTLNWPGFADNIYTGTTLVQANGTLITGTANALSASSSHVINGTLSLAGGSGAIGSLSGAGTVNLGGNTLTINNSGTFTGSVIGTGGSIIKAGVGTLSLAGNNTYTGSTTVSGGELAVDGSIAGDVTVKNGGILGGTGTVGGAVTVESGGTLSPGNSPGQFTLASSLTMLSGSMLQMEFNGVTYGLYDHLDVQGAFVAGGTLDLKIGAGYTPAQGSSFTIFDGLTPGYDSGSFVITTNLGDGLSWDTTRLRSAGVLSIVPEPSTWALLVFGLLFSTVRRVRRAL